MKPIEYSQMIGHMTRDKTSRDPRTMDQEPVTMDQEPRNMYAAGQLVKNTDNGSRPGYNGKQGGKKVPQQGFQKGNTYGLENTGIFKTDEKKLNSLRKTLTNLDEGTTLNVNELHKSTGIARKTIDNIIAKEYGDKFDIPGMGKAQSLNIQKLNKDKQEKSLKEFNKIKKSYSKDLIEKYKFPSGSSKAKKYSNAELAKKYFGEANVATIGRVERLNNKLSKELKLSYPKGNESQTVATRKERLDKAKVLAGEGVADINTAQKDVVKLLNDHYKKNPDELLGNTKLRNLLDLTLEDGEIVKKNKYVTDDDFKKLIQDKKGLFTMDHVDEVQFEKLSTEFPIFKQLATYNTNSGLIKSMKSYMSKNQNSKDPAVQNKIKKQIAFLEDLKLRVDTPTGRVGSKEVLAAVDRKAGVLPNFLAQLRALNIKLPTKAKAAVLGISGGLGATTLATAGPIEETGSTAMDTAKTVGAGAAGAATIGTKTGRKALGKFAAGAFGPLGLVGLNAGLGVDPTQSIDRLGLGLEATFLKDAVKGTVGATKGIKNRALQKGIQRILNAGMSVPTALKVARVASPLGIASLAGEGIYNVGKLGYEDQQRFNALSPEEQAAERAEQEKFAFDIEGS